ncbi:TetR/AcrR family transcriptional regulator C-terminal domain-containing protein [Candidatus Saccharibacteria bacterium]|nr:TetR/AcrR family transcriptional regulator C-terminal domain-containing protein [Candidatus Saccharibacteria bacterium]
MSKEKIIRNLSRQKIVDEAIRLADKDGLKKLSMRKLADSLSVEAMSLYHHIDNKDDLIAEMVDSVAPSIPPLAECQDWKDAIRRRADTMRAVLLAHPWAAHEFVAGFNVKPQMLKYVDTTIGYLVEAGFTYKMADYAWHTIDSYIYGFNLQVQNFPLEPDEYIPAAKQFLPMIPKDTHPYMHGMSLSIINRKHDGIQDFHFGLELILESLDRLITKESKEKI